MRDKGAGRWLRDKGMEKLGFERRLFGNIHVSCLFKCDYMYINISSKINPTAATTLAREESDMRYLHTKTTKRT